MISVIIPTHDSERVLVPTLSALVPGSAEGLVREVRIADGGSQDGTEMIADEAGCDFLRGTGDLGARLRAAANSARGNWLLFLEPVSVLEEGWTRDVGKFIDNTERTGQAGRRAATFPLASESVGFAGWLADAGRAVRLAITGRPRPEQGLLIAKSFYDALGGHSSGEDAPSRLFGKIGRRRMVGLRTCIAVVPVPENT